MSATFEAVNNVIRVRDTNGAVVFDTGTPMPHIAQVITTTLSHTFAASGTSRDRSIGYVSAPFSGCREYQYICRTDVNGKAKVSQRAEQNVATFGLA
jgi:hypothetical protein